MRRSCLAVLVSLLIVSGLVPASALARRVTAGGSVTITGPSGPLTDQIVVTALMSNPGLEKTVTTQLPLPGPLFVLPFFVNEEKNGAQPDDIDTLLLITNTTGAVLSITLTLRGTDGAILATSTPPSLVAHETRVIRLSDLLP
jgi:hypothetical protein